MRRASGASGPTSAPTPTSSLRPTAGSMASLARAPAAAELDHRKPDRAHVDRCDEAAAARARRRCDAARRQVRRRARDEIRRAAERGDHAFEPLRRGAALERALQSRAAPRQDRAQARERKQLGGERERHLDAAAVAARAGQIVDGVQHFERVAGGAGERLVHVGDERDRRQAGAVGDRRDARPQARARSRAWP